MIFCTCQNQSSNSNDKSCNKEVSNSELQTQKEPYHLLFFSLRYIGIIRTALPNMDREVKELYQVLIQAKDMGGQLGGLAGTTTINITLSDVNDNPPRFSKSKSLIITPSMVAKVHTPEFGVLERCLLVSFVVLFFFTLQEPECSR